MPAKSISVSLPEALDWKLEQLEQKYGIPKSALIQKAILLLVAEMSGDAFKFGEIGQDVPIEDIEAEFQAAKVR